MRSTGNDAPVSQQGFSLVELLGGMAILLLAVGGIYSLLSRGAHERQAAEEQHRAFAACRAKMEEVRAMPWAALPALDGTRFPVDVDRDGISDLTAPGGPSAPPPGLIRVSREASEATEVLHRVVISATWQGVAGQRSFSIQSLMTNRFGQ